MTRHQLPPPKSRDDEVLAAILRFVAARGRMPTTKELCADVKIARTQLLRNLARLVRRGQLRKLPIGTLLYRLPVVAA